MIYCAGAWSPQAGAAGDPIDRARIADAWRLDDELLASASESAFVLLPPPPLHRGASTAPALLDDPRCAVWEQIGSEGVMLRALLTHLLG